MDITWIIATIIPLITGGAGWFVGRKKSDAEAKKIEAEARIKEAEVRTREIQNDDLAINQYKLALEDMAKHNAELRQMNQERDENYGKTLEAMRLRIGQLEEKEARSDGEIKKLRALLNNLKKGKTP